uniref:Uncharacterized protein n=1 Tax=Sphingobacterium sp. (strain 21) TaxID=743722 RepID=F4C9R9_SPHS2
MLYTCDQLENIEDAKGRSIALGRLIYKFQNDKRNLKYHELEYICQSLDHLYTAPDIKAKAFTVYDHKECSDCIFRRLIVIYLDNLDFLAPVNKGTHFASKEEIENDRTKLQELFDEWQEHLVQSTIKNAIFHEVKTELNKKLKILRKAYENGAFGFRRYTYIHKQHVFTSKYIYLIVFKYFKKYGINWEVISHDNKNILINHYCYVHILYRHFLPAINGIELEKSFHKEGYLDPFNLPRSIKWIIQRYLNLVPSQNFNKEWFIFSYKSTKCILWWKYKRCNELAGWGYEVRTCYPITLQRDIEKFNSLSESVQFENFIFHY